MWACYGIHQKYFIKLKDMPRPNWNDLMDHLTSEKANSSKSNITMLLLIHFNLIYESCTQLTLLYINDQAKDFNIEITCVTFDQPL